MCVAHKKDISDWLKTAPTLELLKRWQKIWVLSQSGLQADSIKTRVVAIYPSLITVKRGSTENGGGT
jgi:hypothetical protein